MSVGGDLCWVPSHLDGTSFRRLVPCPRLAQDSLQKDSHILGATVLCKPPTLNLKAAPTF